MPEPKNTRRFPLWTKLILLVSLSVALVVAGYLWIVLGLHQRSQTQLQQITQTQVGEVLREEWQRKTKATATTIADLLIQPVYTLDVSDINRILRSVQHQAIVHYIYVLDADKRVLGDGDPETPRLGRIMSGYPARIDTSIHFRTHKNNRKVLEVISPIRLADQMLGMVIIGFPTQEIDQTAQALNREMMSVFHHHDETELVDMLTYGAVVALLGILASCLLARGMVKPIQALAAETRKISAGDFDVRLKVTRRDELGELNQAFLQMSEELRRRDAALSQARQELEQRVRQRTVDLNRTNAQLRREIEERRGAEEARIGLEKRLQHSRKMEALGTLAGGVAHDLNNILTGVVGYPELMLMELPPDSPLRPSLETIQASGEKAAAIVEDLLTLARRGVTRRTVCDLNRLIRDLLDSPEGRQVQELHPEVAIQFDMGPEPLPINGSPVHISKSIMNLLNNAAEAMPRGGQVSIGTNCRYIDRPFGSYDKIRKGQYAVLTVADTGIGIAEGDLARIFEPFYTSKQMGRSGTGLGMAVVWGTIKDHDGYIDVQSTVGKGTTFEVYLPVTRKSLALESETPTLESLRGEGQILVVDDDEAQRELAREILARLGYEVSLAVSGEEGVVAAETRTFDLVILDMIMGKGMDGLETYQAICRQHPGQKALIASGFSDPERVQEAQRLGAGRYLKKPFQLIALAQAVKEALAADGRTDDAVRSEDETTSP